MCAKRQPLLFRPQCVDFHSYIGFGEYGGWTRVKTRVNVSVPCHMLVGLLKCKNERQLQWNLSPPDNQVFVQEVLRAATKGTWKSACMKRFHFMKSPWMIIGRDNFSAARTLKINSIINLSELNAHYGTEAQRYHCKYDCTTTSLILLPRILSYCREFYLTTSASFILAPRVLFYCREFHFSTASFILLPRDLFYCREFCFHHHEFYFTASSENKTCGGENKTCGGKIKLAAV